MPVTERCAHGNMGQEKACLSSAKLHLFGRGVLLVSLDGRSLTRFAGVAADAGQATASQQHGTGTYKWKPSAPCPRQPRFPATTGISVSGVCASLSALSNLDRDLGAPWCAIPLSFFISPPSLRLLQGQRECHATGLPLSLSSSSDGSTPPRSPAHDSHRHTARTFGSWRLQGLANRELFIITRFSPVAKTDCRSMKDRGSSSSLRQASSPPFPFPSSRFAELFPLLEAGPHHSPGKRCERVEISVLRCCAETPPASRVVFEVRTRGCWVPGHCSSAGHLWHFAGPQADPPKPPSGGDASRDASGDRSRPGRVESSLMPEDGQRNASRLEPGDQERKKERKAEKE